jgi:hypothetical protein
MERMCDSRKLSASNATAMESAATTMKSPAARAGTVRSCDMRSKLNYLLCFLALALPASAQLDSAQLRVKFGAPLDRETFHIPAGFDLVVDYGVGHQVCKLQVPALMPTGAGLATNFGNYPYNTEVPLRTSGAAG